MSGSEVVGAVEMSDGWHDTKDEPWRGGGSPAALDDQNRGGRKRGMWLQLLLASGGKRRGLRRRSMWLASGLVLEGTGGKKIARNERQERYLSMEISLPPPKRVSLPFFLLSSQTPLIFNFLFHYFFVSL